VSGKGKEKVTEEQVAHDLLSLKKPKKKIPTDQYIFQRCTSTPTGSFGHDESLYAELGKSDNEEESEKVVTRADDGGQGEGQAGPDLGAQAKGQTGPDASAQDECQARSNPDEQSEGQAGRDPGNAGADEQPMPRFTTMAYSKVQDNLKLIVEEQVLLEEPASSSGTLSSLQNLSKDIIFGDLFFSDKPSEADNDKANAETKVESMVSVTIQQDMSSIPPMTSPIIDLTMRTESPKVHQQFKATTTEKQQQQPQHYPTTISTTKHYRGHDDEAYRDLPEADMKVILHQRMWEIKSYKSHEDHIQVYEALEKSMNRDHSKELAQDLAEVCKKKKKSRESPKTPPGSPPYQPPPPPPPAGPSGASGALGASGSS
nr:hypothetical protein [Tanacetum cinerariifolium]